ncbi:Lipid A export ATP-binding/permease protein MsbA [Rubrivivax sp. A210]|uniref:lipid A export permease/ATP-binding protein MsbA n=1 Tax=Rubrivivax sp. A210 TaxID=2772301 RepID=UPI0019186F2E|nr:lipid A export permease/ATP-binding protein MsbA [Rubrivivax sp. A210]CAD5372483.1 Lipid A export ATP-binding/permease protein MsbA [Rubrivivax sp. A210]
MPTLLQRLARLLPYIRHSRLGLLAALLGAIVTAATEPMIPALLGQLLDRGFAGGGLPLWLVPVVIIGLFTVRSVAGFVAQFGLSWAANRAVLRLREHMFARLLAAAPALFTQNTASGMTNTLVYEAQGGVSTLATTLLTLVRDSLMLVALLAYLLTLNWQLTLIVGLLFPAVALVMRALGRRLHRLTVEGQVATDSLAYVVEENMLAWRIVRLHGAQAHQVARFFERADRVRRLVIKAVVAGGTMTPVTQLLAACAISVVIVIALWQSRNGGSSVGEFTAFVTAMLQLVAPAKHLSDVMAPLTRGLAAVERGLDLIDKSPTELAGGHDPGRARGEIGYEAVSLRYRDDGAAAVEALSLQVRAGETVALVGPSGAGKTTLVNLLPRFIEPTAGRITLDGVALADWDVRALRRQFALVSQDVVLFNDTVAANVTLGAAMPLEQVRQALAAANLLAFVDALPQGLDTPIGHNGSQLSGGQRQRLAIARAVAKDAPVLILDEATSALDSESERAVQEALDRLMQGRTTLVIAHRLSTIEHADRVLALEGGRLVEQGSHAELLAAGGLYARLHAMQFRS